MDRLELGKQIKADLDNAIKFLKSALVNAPGHSPVAKEYISSALGYAVMSRNHCSTLNIVEQDQLNIADVVEAAVSHEESMEILAKIEDERSAELLEQIKDDPNMELLGTACPVCGEPQYKTPSGISCQEGHGGVKKGEPILDKAFNLDAGERNANWLKGKRDGQERTS